MPRWTTGLRLAALAAAAIAGLGLSCLDRGVSCGDGWWDVEFEGCDPQDPERRFVDGCRALGLDVDGRCDAQTCRLQCCGDGLLTGDEQCDGEQFMAGASCTKGCNDDCTIDHAACPPVCGDGLLHPAEECDPALYCDDDDDCPAASPRCHAELHECMPAGADDQADSSCSRYEVTAWNHGKVAPSYHGGEVGRCTDRCVFDREQCSFCGDDVRDQAYLDYGWPDIAGEQHEAEICDGQAPPDPKQLTEKCLLESNCSGVLYSEQLQLQCDYIGCEDCREIVLADIAMSGCCVVSGVPCEPGMNPPCCAWVRFPAQKDMCQPGLPLPTCPGVP